MVQVIRRTPQAPRRNKGQQFAEAISSGVQQVSEHFYNKNEKEKQDKALSDYVGFNVANLDQDTKKEIVKQTAKGKARSQYFGGDDPLANNSPKGFANQVGNTPIDVQTGATPASEYFGETEGQKIKKLEKQLENFQYEGEEDYEKPSKTKPIPMPPPYKAPHTEQQIKKSLGWNIQEGRALQQENADARRAYDAEVKRVQQANQHAEDLEFKKQDMGLKERSQERREYESSPGYLAEKQKTLLGGARDNEVFKNVDASRLKSDVEEASLGAIEDAVINGNQDFLSFNNLAELTGMELWRDAAGGQFKTGVKTFLINSVGKFGARPNQYIETQMADALPKVGRTRSANMMAVNALRFEQEINKKYIEVADQVKGEKFPPGDAGRLIQERMKKYAEEKQNDLKKNYEFIKENQDKIDATPQGRIPMKSSKGKLLWMPKEKVFEALVDGASYI